MGMVLPWLLILQRLGPDADQVYVANTCGTILEPTTIDIRTIAAGTDSFKASITSGSGADAVRRDTKGWSHI
jgi:hypothetical protein